MSASKKNSEFIDIKGLFNQYKRNWYWFAISVFLCCLIGYVYAKKHPRENIAKSSILVTQDDSTVNMMNGLGGLFGADPYVQDEIFVIKSHSILKSVVKELGLNKIHTVKTGLLTSRFEYPEYPVDVVFDSEIADTLSTMLNFTVSVDKNGENADIKLIIKDKKVADFDDVKLPYTIKTGFGDFTVTKTKAYPKEKESLKTWINVFGYDGAAEALNLEVLADIASKKSNVIDLSIKSTNSRYICDVLNSIMAVYNRRGIEERNQRALKTAEFIEERLMLIGAALNDAESEIETYKEGNRLVDVQAEAALNSQLKTKYESQLVDLQTREEILKMTRDFLTSDANKFELLPVVSLDGVERDHSIESYNQLILRRMNMLVGAKENNRYLMELDKQINAMRANILVATQQALETNRIAINEARGQANMAVSKLGNIPTQERQYIGLKRQQEVKQQLYLFLLQRSEETAMLIANAIPKGQIIDPAFILSEPIGAGTKTILAVAFIVGLFIVVVVLYIKDFFHTRIDSRSDIEKNTDLPILGEICVDKTGHKLVVNPANTSATSELFRMVRSNLQFILTGADDKVVMITSSRSSEGKSFISTNLAASLALLNKKVVLIGMDIRKPQLANYLGLSPTPGLTQYLSDSSMPVGDIIQSYDEIPDLDIIVAGPIPPNPGELMNSPRIAELIAKLREMYDYVIVDTAPIGMVSDSFNISKLVDATIYVMRENVTHTQDVVFLNEKVDEGRLKRVNIILNGSSTQKGYGYGYNNK